ncbi:MAG: transketolase [Planctomycetota bacterium]|nr:MAG: transketolase [Planctomycetota bacterium]
MPKPFDDVDRLAVNTLRVLAIDAVEQADSGHPGLPLGAAPMAYTLWQRELKFDPSDPKWPDRDRFVLSAGHGSMLLYGLLHCYGFPLSMEEIRNFRQLGSRTPGHPEQHLTPGVEATTGPLGQGAGVAVGMAIAERHLAARFNRPGHEIVNHTTFALVSDGDLMEGVSAEAGSLAGHLRLGKLIYLYDSNRVSLDAPTSVTFTEDVGRRYAAYGWQVLKVADGDHDLVGLQAAIRKARRETRKPSLIIVHTTIGYGSPHKAGTFEAHGAPLGQEEARLTKQALGWDPGREFHVPEAAAARFAETARRGARARRKWAKQLAEYTAAFPDLAQEWEQALTLTPPPGWDQEIPRFQAGESVATRVAAGKVENAVAKRVPFLIGGDADLGGSTKTPISGGGDFDGQTGSGRNLHFGVREHAMGAICNGMAYHGGARPFAATFLQFSDYMRPPVRLASLDHLPVIYVWTHDSIGLGEDGPTHQPVEHLWALRAIPGLRVIRPCDANEAAEAWRFVIAHPQRPAALVLSRQNLPVLDRARCAAASGLARGGYVLADGEPEPDLVLIATGSEVHLALGARERLAQEGVKARVVSMPCVELFEEQEAAYREQVLPPSVGARVAVEAGRALGWWKHVGERGVAVGVEKFGASAPAKVLFAEYAFTVENVVAAARQALRNVVTA